MNGTYSADDKTNIGSEMKALGQAIIDIHTNTKFNGTGVFTATSDIKYGEDGGQTVTIAAYTYAGSSLDTLTDLTTLAVSAATADDVTTTIVENAITEVNTHRATYGAQQNQLEHAANNLSTTKENLQAAESRVRDVDMADEMMEYTKNNILIQAAQAMLAQANSQPQGVLQLLQ
jgi:flagellin